MGGRGREGYFNAARVQKSMSKQRAGLSNRGHIKNIYNTCRIVLYDGHARRRKHINNNTAVVNTENNNIILL